jgi:hypothetical protein
LAHLIPEVVEFPLILPQQAAEFLVVLKSIFGLVTRPMIEIFWVLESDTSPGEDWHGQMLKVFHQHEHWYDTLKSYECAITAFFLKRKGLLSLLWTRQGRY